MIPLTSINYQQFLCITEGKYNHSKLARNTRLQRRNHLKTAIGTPSREHQGNLDHYSLPQQGEPENDLQAQLDEREPHQRESDERETYQGESDERDISRRVR